jgi:hypothetical protein
MPTYGAALLRVAARFRRIKHHRELPHLVRALRPATSTEVRREPHFVGAAQRATATIGSGSMIIKGAAVWIPPTVTNSMVDQEEHAYSLDHRSRRPQPNSTASGTTPVEFVAV